MTRGPGVAGVLDGAQIETGSPLNMSDVDVVMVGHVPDTVGSMVGDGPLPLLPPLELLPDPELLPEDPEDPAAPEEPEEVTPDDPLAPPEPPPPPLPDEYPDPEVDPPELPLWPEDPPPLEAPVFPKSPERLPDGALLPHAVRMPSARATPVPRTAKMRCMPSLDTQWR
jgi:hypothetical protein